LAVAAAAWWQQRHLGGTNKAPAATGMAEAQTTINNQLKTAAGNGNGYGNNDTDNDSN
jgi:hypothetical protein